MNVRNIQVFKTEPQKAVKKDSFEIEIAPIEHGETFTKYIRGMMRNRNKPITNEVLGRRLGLSTEMCTKVINKQKDGQSRDCIIAICIALEMTPAQTSKALILYDSLPRLDRQNRRDDCIINILENNAGAKKGEWIENANRVLESMGLACLDIIKHRASPKKEKSTKTSVPYGKPRPTLKVLSRHIGPTVYQDPYGSLATAWDLWLFNVNSQMRVLDEEKNTTYLLTAEADGRLSMHELINGVADNLRAFKSPDDTGEFRDFFNYLLGAARNGRRWLLNHVDDTRNYYMRTAARIHKDHVCIFVERYNYSMSERHEFYLMERIAEKHRLSVFHESAFMSRYLGEDEYRKQYDKEPPAPIMVFETIEEAEEADRKAAYYSSRKTAFSFLATEVDNCFNRIKNGNVVIRDWKSIFDTPGDVCRFFGVENEFQCRTVQMHPWYEKEPAPGTPEAEEEGVPFLIANANEADFSLEDGSVVTVTLDQLLRAFDLGCNDIGQICRIIGKTGTIESVLN